MVLSGKKTPDIDFLNECFLYDDGCLIWKERPIGHFKSIKSFKSWNAKHAWKRAGRSSNSCGGYRQIGINNERHLEHRIIAAMFGIDTSVFIDHIDGNPSNNRIENLRSCTKHQNARNNSGWCNKKERVGVSRKKAKEMWVAYIRTHGKHVHLGTFKTEEEANIARELAEKNEYGQYRRSYCEERNNL